MLAGWDAGKTKGWRGAANAAAGMANMGAGGGCTELAELDLLDDEGCLGAPVVTALRAGGGLVAAGLGVEGGLRLAGLVTRLKAVASPTLASSVYLPTSVQAPRVRSTAGCR